jgi:cell division protein ZapA (FtsZ GTPase activity inhibitor)
MHSAQASNEKSRAVRFKSDVRGLIEEITGSVFDQQFNVSVRLDNEDAIRVVTRDVQVAIASES